MALRYDKCIVIKSYNEFSLGAKKLTELKDFFVFCKEEWSKLLRNVPTRWLSLIPAVQRLLKYFNPVKTYFLSQKAAPAILVRFFEN